MINNNTVMKAELKTDSSTFLYSVILFQGIFIGTVQRYDFGTEMERERVYRSWDAIKACDSKSIGVRLTQDTIKLSNLSLTAMYFESHIRIAFLNALSHSISPPTSCRYNCCAHASEKNQRIPEDAKPVFSSDFFIVLLLFIIHATFFTGQPLLYGVYWQYHQLVLTIDVTFFCYFFPSLVH